MCIDGLKCSKFLFNTRELLQLVTSNFYSILYQNSEIWHLNNLKGPLKQKLLSSSARALKSCVKYCTRNVSQVNIHKTLNRATPDQFLLYRHALTLFKLFHCPDQSSEWVALNFNQILTSRQTNFISTKSNRKRVGSNAIANRVFIVSSLDCNVWSSFYYPPFYKRKLQLRNIVDYTKTSKMKTRHYSRDYLVNDKIPLTWFNMSLGTFKVHCKRVFLV